MAFNYYQPYGYSQQESANRLKKMRDEIDEQLSQIQQQPVPQIQQTFITPPTNSQNDIPARWVNSYEDVKAVPVYMATIFMDRNKSRFYLKDESGSIKSFDFIEVEELDEKDIRIRELENKIKELERGNQDGKSVNEHVREQQQPDGKSITTGVNDTIKKAKSTSI